MILHWFISHPGYLCFSSHLSTAYFMVVSEVFLSGLLTQGQLISKAISCLSLLLTILESSHMPEHPNTPVPLLPQGYNVYQAKDKDDLQQQDLQDGVMSCKVLGLQAQGRQIRCEPCPPALYHTAYMPNHYYCLQRNPYKQECKISHIPHGAPRSLCACRSPVPSS